MNQTPSPIFTEQPALSLRRCPEFDAIDGCCLARREGPATSVGTNVPSIALDNFALGTTEPAIGTLEGCACRCPSATAGESLQPLAHWGCRLSGFWLNVGNADVSGRRGGQNREPVARRRLRYHSIRLCRNGPAAVRKGSALTGGKDLS